MTGAITVRSGSAQAIVEPSFGGRITSLRLAGREWLQQAAVPLVPAHPFDDFVRPDIGGWDEMLPTCVPVTFDGVGLPDHGDVWSATWDVVDAGADHVELAVDCRTVPVRVVRRLGVTGAATGDTVRLDYTVTNVGESPAPGFWMAHPLLDATDLVDVTFEPADVEWHRTIADPHPPADKHERAPHLLPHSLTPGGYRKYRATAPVAAAALHARDGAELRIAWDLPVPVHVQLWVDNAGIGGVPVIAVEPATAAGDDPVAARAAGALPTLQPGDTMRFTVRLSGRPGPGSMPP
ncbi:MAG: hypothetical protein ACRD0G_00875 [Acidimicrobiales bacterium]